MNKQVTEIADKEAYHGVIKNVGRGVGKAAAFLLVTILLIAVGLYGVMWVLMKGPSPTAQKLFTLSVRETSAVGFLANMYLSEAEIAEIVENEAANAVVETTDASLITVSNSEQSSDTQQATDEQEQTGSSDGITIEEITGATYRGKMMIVDDPLRIFVGTPGRLWRRIQRTYSQRYG